MRNFFRLFVFTAIFAMVATTNMSAQLGRKKVEAAAPAAEAAKPIETAAAEAPAAETAESSPLTEEKLSEVVAAAFANHQAKMWHLSPRSVIENDIFTKALADQIKEAIAASKFNDKVNRAWWMSVGGLAFGVLALLVAFLKQPAEKKSPAKSASFTSPGPGGSAATLALALGFAFTANAAPTCYNAETGKTPGSVKAAIAIVSVDNTFACAVSGKKVELVDPEDAAKVVLVGTVTKESPAIEFTFKPTTEGRLVVKVDGKVFNQIAIRDEKTAVAINDALDLAAAAPTASSSEKDFQSFLMGLAQHCEVEYKEVLQGLRSPKAGTSKEAVARLLHGCDAKVIDKVFGDDRWTKVQAANSDVQKALESLNSAVQAPASKEDLERVERKADAAYEEAEAAVRTADEAKSAAENFKQQLIEANRVATLAMQKASRVYDVTAKSGTRSEKKALAEPKPQATAAAKPKRASRGRRVAATTPVGPTAAVQMQPKE